MANSNSTVKIYVHQSTDLKDPKDYLTGYYNAMTVDDLGTVTCGKTYAITSWNKFDTKVVHKILGPCAIGYAGRCSSYEAYYKNTPNVTICYGSLLLREQRANNETRVSKACWVAAHNGKTIQFEIHTSTNQIISTYGVDLVFTDNAKYETNGTSKLLNDTQVMCVPRLEVDFGVLDTSNWGEKSKDIARMLIEGYRNKDIMAALGVSNSVVSRVKVQLKEQSLL